MILTAFTTCLMLLSSGLLLRVREVRQYLRGVLRYGQQVTIQTADLMVQYIQWYLFVGALDCFLIFLALIFHWPYVIGFLVFLSGAVMIIPALLFKQLTTGLTNSLVGARRSLTGALFTEAEQRRLSSEITEAFKAIGAAAPTDDKNQKFWAVVAEKSSSLLRALFSPQTSIRMLTAPARLAADTAKGILESLTGIFAVLAMIQIWVMVVGIAALLMPHHADPFWVLLLGACALLTGYCLILIGEWEPAKIFKGVAHWCKWGIAIALIGIMVTAISPFVQARASHLLVGMDIQGRVAMKALAQYIFGKNYDQQICRVVTPGTAYTERDDGTYDPAGTMTYGRILWRTTRPEFVLQEDGPYYGEYYTQNPAGLAEPSLKKVLFQESGTEAIKEVGLKTGMLAKGTSYSTDVVNTAGNHQPANNLVSTNRDWQDVWITNNVSHRNGQRVNLCRVPTQAGDIFVWVSQDSLKQVNTLQ